MPLLKFDTTEAAYQASAFLLQPPATDGVTKYKYAVVENILTGEVALDIPNADYEEVTNKLNYSEFKAVETSFKDPLWHDEELLHGQKSLMLFLDPPLRFHDPNIYRQSLLHYYKSTIVYASNKGKQLIELVNASVRKDEALKKLSGFEFEDFISELLSDQGFYIFQTPRTRDGGKDIVCAYQDQNRHWLTLVVQCKKTSKNTIDPNDVRALLGVHHDDQMHENKFNYAMLVTNSKLGEESKRYEQRHAILSLKEREDIDSWLSQYGRYKEGLWLPSHFQSFFRN